jgi:Derlin-2/3
MDGLVEKYWQIPPITRNLTTVVFFFSLACYTGLLPFMEFIYLGPLIFKMPPQLWRLATSSIITGKDLSILFDTYWLYQYLKQLETGHPKFPKKSDLVWYLLFVLAVIQVCWTFSFFSRPLTYARIIQIRPLVSARAVLSPHGQRGS